jgi:sortase A
VLTNIARIRAGAVLFLAGVAVLAVALAGYLQGPAWQHLHPEEVVPEATRSPTPRNSVPRPALGAPFARLKISRIGINVTVIEGTRSRDLLKAPGHLTGSGLPGQPENCIIAGHRDLHFRRLGELRVGDAMQLVKAGSRSTYRVEAIRVIDPSETSVLNQGSMPILTLVTCYPFRYVGTAPQRYVVVGRLTGVTTLPTP